MNSILPNLKRDFFLRYKPPLLCLLHQDVGIIDFIEYENLTHHRRNYIRGSVRFISTEIW